MQQNHIERIRKAPIFHGIREKDFLPLLDSLDSQLKHYPKGQIVLKSGRKTNRAGLLLEGNVSVYREGFWNQRYLIGEVMPSELIAISFAASNSTTANVTCLAATSCVILWFHIQDLFSQHASSISHTTMIQNIMSALAMQNLNLGAKVAHVTQKTTREKLLSYLSEEYWKHGTEQFDIPYSRQELADYLSVNRSAMSNELSKLRKEKYLITKKNHFILLNKEEGSHSL